MQCITRIYTTKEAEAEEGACSEDRARLGFVPVVWVAQREREREREKELRRR
jgi:hypothetical protein